MLNVVFWGEKSLSVSCLKYLLQQPNINVLVVCTRKISPVWWGDQVLRLFCERQAIPILDFDHIGDFQIDWHISVLYPFILSKEVLKKARLGCVNLHEAPLPRWKGCNGYAHAILEEDVCYGTTLHSMQPELDSGDVYCSQSFEIDPHETVKELYNRTTEASLALFSENINAILFNKLPISQKTQSIQGDTYLNTRGSLIQDKDLSRQSNWKSIYRKARALDFEPWEPAFYDLNQDRYYVFIKGSGGRVAISGGIKRILDVSRSIDYYCSKNQVIELTFFERILIICPSNIYRKYFSCWNF